MKGLKKSLKTVFLFNITLSLLFMTSCEGGTKNKLANKRYVDPKGYFKIVPPAGWRIQEYPQDPRGKVAFIAPASNTDLRVLVNAVDFTTIDDLVRFCKNIESRIGISTNIERTTFGGRPAVKRSFEAKGLRFIMYDFLIGSVDHNLQFAAPPSNFQKYLPIVMKSMETYEPVVRAMTDQDVIKHAVAKKRRLARLMIEMGNYDLALEFIKEGLELSPRDDELHKLKEEIERRK